MDSAQRANEKEAAAEYKADAALREALAGRAALAKQDARAALALSSCKNVEAISAIALGLVDDSAHAAKLADDLGQRFPEDKMVRFENLPMVQAAIALRGGHPAKAVDDLAAAEPYERGAFIFPYPVYLRALQLFPSHPSGGAN